MKEHVCLVVISFRYRIEIRNIFQFYCWYYFIIYDLLTMLISVKVELSECLQNASIIIAICIPIF